jgi:hypothetical protein
MILLNRLLRQFEQNNNKQTSGLWHNASFPRKLFLLSVLPKVKKRQSRLQTIPSCNEPRNEFTEQSLARLSQVLLDNKANDKAIPVLIR